jgi:hypothetical protein
MQQIAATSVLEPLLMASPYSPLLLPLTQPPGMLLVVL